MLQCASSFILNGRLVARVMQRVIVPRTLKFGRSSSQAEACLLHVIPTRNNMNTIGHEYIYTSKHREHQRLHAADRSSISFPYALTSSNKDNAVTIGTKSAPSSCF
jgi:hypothetical protein